LLVIVTIGVDGSVNGAAVPVPAALVHPFTVAVTLYVAAAVTVIEDVVAPVFHDNVPVEMVVNKELPQLLYTNIIGVAGVLAGAAMPVAAALVHPPDV
jgi:hypothetical protein